MISIKDLRHIFFRFRLKRASAIQRAEMLRPYFYHIGSNVKIYTNNIGTEPYLISLADNVTIAGGVHFVNHDVSVFNMARFLGIDERCVDKVGSIEIRDNAFVGAFSILMPNIVIGRNSVIAAGSVVTKDIPDNEVWGGVPARFIMKTEDYAKKIIVQSSLYPWMGKSQKVNSQNIIQMRQNYFFK